MRKAKTEVTSNPSIQRQVNNKGGPRRNSGWSHESERIQQCRCAKLKRDKSLELVNAFYPDKSTDGKKNMPVVD